MLHNSLFKTALQKRSADTPVGN